jgi:hypothetical protein
MSRWDAMQECDQEVATLLAELPRPEQKAVAAMTLGVVRAGSVVLAEAASAAPVAATPAATMRRFQRVLANERFAVEPAEDAAMAALLRGCRGRLDVLVDLTTVGASRRYPGTMALVVAIIRQDQAVPVMCRCFAPGTAQGAIIPALDHMLAQLKRQLPPRVVPTLMADRGLGGAPIAAIARQHGFHLLVRVQRGTQVRRTNGTVTTIGALVPAPGTSTLLTGVRVYAPRGSGGHGRPRDWDHAPVLNVVAVWRAGDAEPWLLVTDRAAALGRCDDYRRRTWEEELFRNLKRMGFQWQRSRVHAPARMERLAFVLALAMRWVVALGRRTIKRGRRRWFDPAQHRRVSTFRLGLRTIARLLALGERVPCCLAHAL